MKRSGYWGRVGNIAEESRRIGNGGKRFLSSSKNKSPIVMASFSVSPSLIEPGTHRHHHQPNIRILPMLSRNEIVCFLQRARAKEIPLFSPIPR
jgi:hypothetical protein